jgi:hypothetical protein
MRHTDLRRLREHLLVKTLAAAHDRRENRHFLVRIRRAQVRQDLLGGLEVICKSHCGQCCTPILA